MLVRIASFLAVKPVTISCFKHLRTVIENGDRSLISQLSRSASDRLFQKKTLGSWTTKATQLQAIETSLLQSKEANKLQAEKQAICSKKVISSSPKMSVNESSVIAVCQMNSYTGDINANLRTCKDLIERAKTKGAKVVFLPEGFDYLIKDKKESVANAQPLDGPRMQEFCQLAKTNDVWLSLGGFHCKHPSDSNRVFNSHVLVDNGGSIVSVYNKTHLFDISIQGGPNLMESSFCAPGCEIVPPVTTPVGKVGLAICYDLRFPELSLCLAKQGADILTFPSAFTHITGSAHWEVLLRSRAIETQCYVLAAAQTGECYPGRRSYGHSMVVDPWGCVIAQCHEGTDLCVAEIDHSYLKKVRSEMPVWSHRRPRLYGDLTTE